VNTPPVRVASSWLALREGADAASRSRALVRRLEMELPIRPGARLRVHDLASGTGSMARWLAPLLPGQQQWLLHDLDEDLLAIATAGGSRTPPYGAGVSVEARKTDITMMRQIDLAGATLITASALLDMLSEPELAGLISVCIGAGCPVLFSLSVVGQVTLSPSDPLDTRIAAAFDDHQRRRTNRGRLLGPDAPAFAAEAFRAHGYDVLLEPSPWRLGGAQLELTSEWFSGWLGAALEQDQTLSGEADDYRAVRLTQARAGVLRATVGHVDLLALPGSQSRPKREDSA
jgi:hypothetical protein